MYNGRENACFGARNAAVFVSSEEPFRFSPDPAPAGGRDVKNVCCLGVLLRLPARSRCVWCRCSVLSLAGRPSSGRGREGGERERGALPPGPAFSMRKPAEPETEHDAVVVALLGGGRWGGGGVVVRVVSVVRRVLRLRLGVLIHHLTTTDTEHAVCG